MCFKKVPPNVVFCDIPFASHEPFNLFQFNSNKCFHFFGEECWGMKEGHVPMTCEVKLAES